MYSHAYKMHLETCNWDEGYVTETGINIVFDIERVTIKNNYFDTVFVLVCNSTYNQLLVI